jgi:hypothetical protein
MAQKIRKNYDAIPQGLAKVAGQRTLRGRLHSRSRTKTAASLDSTWDELYKDLKVVGESFHQTVNSRKSLPPAPRKQSLPDVLNFGENHK